LVPGLRRHIAKTILFCGVSGRDHVINNLDGVYEFRQVSDFKSAASVAETCASARSELALLVVYVGVEQNGLIGLLKRIRENEHLSSCTIVGLVGDDGKAAVQATRKFIDSFTYYGVTDAVLMRVCHDVLEKTEEREWDFLQNEDRVVLQSTKSAF
jgi:hypothetical protein